MLYTSSYLAGVMWLCLRFSPLYPAADPSIVALDPVLCIVTIAVYIYGLVSPLYTSLALHDQLTRFLRTYLYVRTAGTVCLRVRALSKRARSPQIESSFRCSHTHTLAQRALPASRAGSASNATR